MLHTTAHATAKDITEGKTTPEEKLANDTVDHFAKLGARQHGALDHFADEAEAAKQLIHIGDLMSICSIKFWECPREQWKYKGRICFRGDATKDASGAAAVFQELTASPTSIQSADANIAYGMLPGQCSETSDAPKAYCQSLLKSKAPTWVG